MHRGYRHTQLALMVGLKLCCHTRKSRTALSCPLNKAEREREIIWLMGKVQTKYSMKVLKHYKRPSSIAVMPNADVAYWLGDQIRPDLRFDSCTAAKVLV